MPRRSATVAYHERLAEVRRQLDRLSVLLDEHEAQQEQRPRDWGHPGDLAHVAEKLQEVIDFLCDEGD